MPLFSNEKPAVQLAEYIQDCYKMSSFCDLNLVASGREAVPCHKLVLCSLSTRLRSICLAEEDAGDITHIHLPEFALQEVRDVVDKVYGSIGRSKVKMERSEVMTTLGIECTPLKPGIVTPSVKVEAKYSDDEHEDDSSITGDFSYSEPFEESAIKHEVDEDLREDAFQDKRQSKRRRKVVKSQYKEDSDFDMDDEDDGDEDFAHSSSDDDVKPVKTEKMSHPDGSTDIIQFNEYTGTRKEFWKEDFVKEKLKVSHIKKIYFA